MGGHPPRRVRPRGGGPPGHQGGGSPLTAAFDELFRTHWWAAVAAVTAQVGDLELAEDAVQDACAAALAQWPADGTPANPGPWLIGTARHKALDRLRREGRRVEKEAEAVREAGPSPPPGGWPVGAADELGLIFMCCHPALDPAARVALTLRSVCGMDTRSIAAAFLLPEPTVAQRIVRAKRKIRQAGIRMRVPGADELAPRLTTVFRVVYLVYSQGHMAPAGPDLVRAELCDQAIGLARALSGLLPGE